MSSVDQQPIIYGHPWLKGKTGWLKNKARKERKDRPGTFTDEDCGKLIRMIEEEPHYISEKLGVELNKLVRLRDKALISIAWIFFKRGGEVLKLKRKDINLTETEIFVTFTISKKQKRYKTCGTLRHKFAEYVHEWVLNFDELAPNGPEAWFFPALRIHFSNGYFDLYSLKAMTIQNFNRILKRLDPTMTSSLFRYGGAEKYLLLGYSPRELKEIGDWSTSYMPEVYAERKGLTPTQQRWSEDTR